MRALSRALRRSGLPVYFSEGFNPKPKLSYRTRPLSVGYTSECERARFALIGETEEEEAGRAVADALPPGFVVLELARAGGLKGGADSGNYEYLAFIRRGAVPQGDVTGAPGMRKAEEDEIAAARIFCNGRDTNKFVHEHFGTALVIEAGPDREWQRPDRMIEGVLDLPEDPGLYLIHRFREAVGLASRKDDGEHPEPGQDKDKRD